MGIGISLLRRLVGGVFGAWTLWRQGPPRISDFHHAIFRNDIQKITQLMQENPLFVNAIYNEETAFSRALDFQHLDAAIAIMESAHFDPDAVNQMKKTALNSCVQHRATDDFIPRLLAMGADPNIPDKRGHTPLMCCTSYDNHRAAQDLLSYGADPDKGDSMDYTPLYRACCYASVNTVDVLILYGCDVNKATKDLSTPLMAALPSSRDVQIDRNNIVSDTLLICDMLVAAGCDINAQDKNGKTALHLCVDRHDLFGLCFLVEKGCDLSVKDNKGYTALQNALLPRKCRYEIARHLLYFGADARTPLLNVLNNERVFPIALVLKTVPALFQTVFSWSRTQLLIVLRAAASPTPGPLPTLYTKIQSLNSALPLPENLLFNAQVETDVSRWTNSCDPCSLQHQARLKIREILGSRTNIIPKINSLPLGRDVKRFVGLGVPVDSISFLKLSRLYLYIGDELYMLVQELLDSGIDINIPMGNCTPLSLAITKKNIQIALALLHHHPRPRGLRINANGDSVLHIAAFSGAVELVDELIQLCGTVDPINDNLATPLTVAVICNNFDVAVLLVQRGANVFVTSINGVPLINIAAGKGVDELVGLFLEKGVGPNLQDPVGNTPLHLAACMGIMYRNSESTMPGAGFENWALEPPYHIGIIKSATGHRRASNQTNPMGGHQADVVRRLIRSGADLNIMNDDEKTPLDFGMEYGSEEVRKALNINVE